MAGDVGFLEYYNNFFPVHITSQGTNASGLPVYAATEQTFAPAVGDFSNALSPRQMFTSGTTAPTLVEINNTVVSTPCYAHAKLRGIVAGQELYEFAATGGMSGQPTAIYYSGSISSGYYTDWPLPDMDVIRLLPDGPITFRSISPPGYLSGKTAGRQFELANAAAFPSTGQAPKTITMLHEDSLGSPGSRFNTPDGNPVILQPQEAMKLKYTDGRLKFGELRPINPYTSTMGGGAPAPLPLLPGSITSGMIGSGNFIPPSTYQPPLTIPKVPSMPTPTSGSVNIGMGDFQPPPATLASGFTQTTTTGPIPYLKYVTTSGIAGTMTQSPYIGMVDGQWGAAYSGSLVGLNVSGLNAIDATGFVHGDGYCYMFTNLDNGQSGARHDSLGPWILRSGSAWERPIWFQSGQPFLGSVHIYSYGDDNFYRVDKTPDVANYAHISPWRVSVDPISFTQFNLPTVTGASGVMVTAANRQYIVGIISGSAGTDVVLTGQSGIIASQTSPGQWTLGNNLNVALTGQSGIITTQTGPFAYTIGTNILHSGSIGSGMISSGAIPPSSIYSGALSTGAINITGQSGIIVTNNDPSDWLVGINAVITGVSGATVTQTSTTAWRVGVDPKALSGQINAGSGGSVTLYHNTGSAIAGGYTSIKTITGSNGIVGSIGLWNNSGADMQFRVQATDMKGVTQTLDSGILSAGGSHSTDLSFPQGSCIAPFQTIDLQVGSATPPTAANWEYYISVIT